MDCSHGDLVSIDMDFCCPPARSLLSAYKEYPLSVVTCEVRQGLGCPFKVRGIRIVDETERCHRPGAISL